MPTECIYNSTPHNVPWANWNGKQQRKKIGTTQVNTNCQRIDSSWVPGRKTASGCPQGRKTYRVFTNYSRARKRMDGEEVYGTKIKVQFSSPGQDSSAPLDSQSLLKGKKGNWCFSFFLLYFSVFVWKGLDKQLCTSHL